MRKLSRLGLSENKLSSFDFPSGLTSLAFVSLRNNQLTNLTIPPDMQQLMEIFTDGNSLTTLVLSEPLAATNLADTVTSLRNQGVSVFSYPLMIQLISPRRTTAEAFKFTLSGPPGRYTILNSTDLVNWSGSGALTNVLGSADFTNSEVSGQKFFRASSAP